MSTGTAEIGMTETGAPERVRATQERASTDPQRSQEAPYNARLAAKRNATDDEILGLDAAGGLAAGQSARAEGAQNTDFSEASGQQSDSSKTGIEESDPAKTGAEESSDNSSDANRLDAVLAFNPELKQAWDDARAYRETFRTPQEARMAGAALTDLTKLDALFFSGNAQDHAELAKVVASLDPAAFRSLAKAMGEVASQPLANSREPTQATESPRENHPTATGANSNALTGQRGSITPAQEQFFHATNVATVQAVMDSIESQVDRLLPEEISKGARNRLVGEIYRELDAGLRADRQFASQAREAFRSGALDAEHQRAIVSLVTGRVRQALPGVARRVMNEWTSAIVAANHDRRARQRAAEKRIDIAGAGRTGGDGIRPVTPRDINYSRMSDADILNL